MLEPFSTQEPIRITAAGITVTLDPDTLVCRIDTPARSWQQDPAFAPHILLKNGSRLFFSLSVTAIMTAASAPAF